MHFGYSNNTTSAVWKCFVGQSQPKAKLLFQWTQGWVRRPVLTILFEASLHQWHPKLCFRSKTGQQQKLKVISTTFRDRFLLQKPENAQTTPTLQNLCCIGMQNIAHYEVNVLSKQTKVSRVRTTAGDVSTGVWKRGQRDSAKLHSSSTAEFSLSLREEELTANNFLNENCLKPKIKKLPESHRIQ